ncbi:UNVERIFIED_CONTAM: Uridine nucleosidase 1 [Sesamum latifolium]|uniref:Uridine nucleosidase 1 n=1 Tax=Sesamum latifolium TaxID=2727402 RepID=A0AAW2TZT1_9LAMI
MSISQSGGIDGVVVSDNCFSKKREKIIIDTDPGIDDSMAILMAFQSPELEILGLTTIFGNVTTEDATRNALLLCEIAGCPDLPVAEGSPEPLKRGPPRIADFVHGSNGLGNVVLPLSESKKSEKSASEFLVDKVLNILAIKRDSSFASKVKRVVILGGSFFALGNVNPAAEANIYGDPEAADIVFTSGANIDVVGINITTQVKMTDSHLDELSQSKGRHAQLLCDMCKFYRDWHVKSDGVYGIFLHDPVSFVALVRPDLFTFKKGVVRVETQGICVGHTLMDQGLKKWNTSNPWTDISPISVAWTVNVEEVLNYINGILKKPRFLNIENLMGSMEEKFDDQLLILYASQTGNAMDAAERLGREAERRGCPSVSVLSIDEFQPIELPNKEAVIFIVSTTGQGDNPDSMKFVAKKLDKRLSDLGATAIIERGLGDDQHPSG